MDIADIKNQLASKPFVKINALVYESLAEDIITARLKPGTKIYEKHIADELGISRTPVHMAVQQLLREGLAVKSEYGAPVVSRITHDDCMALCDIRKCLEGDAAYYAARLISNEELSELKLQLDRMRYEKSDSKNQSAYHERMTRANVEFHRLIVAAAKSKYIYMAYMLIHRNIARYLWYLNSLAKFPLQPSSDGYQLHVSIYEALRSHNSTIAKAEVQSEIERMYLIRFPE